jgi:DNA-binding FadR family transcriptional regulator
MADDDEGTAVEEMPDIADAAREAVFAPIGGPGLVAQTVRRLGEAIGLGLLREGERLPNESELAARLEIAPMTLRQALAILRESGYLHTTRGRGGGTFVRSARPRPLPEGHEVMDAEQLRDVTEFRIAVSGHAAALAAERATPGELDQLGELVDSMSRRGAFTAYRQLDARFHLGIAAASRSRRLVSAESDVQRDLLGALLLAGENPADGSLEASNDQHLRILAALRARDPERARAETEAHVRSTADLLVGMRLGMVG